MKNKMKTTGVILLVLLAWSCASKAPTPNSVDANVKKMDTATKPEKNEVGVAAKNANTQPAEQKQEVNKSVAAPPAGSKENLQNVLEAHTCKNGVEVRTLRVEKTSQNGCKLWYSNYKKEGPVAWSSNGSEHCLKVQRQIIGSLGVGSFTCVQN